MSSDSGLPVLPVGLQSFRRLRDMGAVYVDKTEQLCHMIGQAPVFSFIGRPRRFGKSLMLSTLRELFLGNRELFAGTWAYDHYDFTPFPVLYIDFGKVVSKPDFFADQLTKYMRRQAALHGVDISGATDSAEILDLVLEHYGQDNPVVVLVDEYDRPLVDRISEPVEFDVVADVLKDFYVKLKANPDSIRKCVMTGITEFGKLSIFSGANQFSNLSLRPEYVTLFGYTRAEIEANFGSHVVHAQHISGLIGDAWWDKLRYWYNGYCWDRRDMSEATRVYCPFTVVNYFDDPTDFANYWAQSGTSSLLVEILKAGKVNTLDLENKQVSVDQIMSLNPHDINIPGLLFQTGYLTLTGQVPLNPETYLVGYPNREVITSLNMLQLAYLSTDTTASTAIELFAAVRGENWGEFIRIINTIMAGISYEIFHKHEHYAHAIVHTILSASRLDVSSQVHTSRGRIDIVINYTTADDTPKQAIIELKTSAIDDKTDPDHAKDHELAKQAYDQIHTTGYLDSYPNPVPIGIVINTQNKQITAWMTS